MRIAALIAVPLLVAGCSHIGGNSGQTSTTAQTSAGTSATTTSAPSGSKQPAPSTAPGAGAAMSDVIAWIEAGHPADPGRYHTATRDGVATPLDNDIAFTVAAGKVVCMTDSKHTGNALVCLVDLANPPPRPETAYGE